MAGISDDVENLRIQRADFMNALEEVHPAFGVSEEELQSVVQNGIIHYGDIIEVRRLCPFHSLQDHLLPKPFVSKVRLARWPKHKLECDHDLPTLLE